MALSDEDKKRIKEEEDFRAKIRSKNTSGKSGCLPVLIIFIGIVFFGNQISSCSKERQDEQQKLELQKQRLEDNAKQKKEEEDAKLAVIQEQEKRRLEFISQRESLVPDLQNLFNKNDFNAVIQKGEKYQDVDENVRLLVKNATLAQAKQNVANLMTKQEYKSAYEIANQYDDPELRATAQVANKMFTDREEKQLLADLKSTSTADIAKQTFLLKALHNLLPNNETYKQKFDNIIAKQEAYQKQAAEEEQAKQAEKNAVLHVVSWNWGKSSNSYTTAEGLVRNNSGTSLDSVHAKIIVYDSSDNFITSDESLIDYRPLLPGQTSPFKILFPWNPAMKKAHLQFSTFGGKQLDFIEIKKKKK